MSCNLKVTSSPAGVGTDNALVLSEPINSGIVGNRSAKLAQLVEGSATSDVRDET